MGGSGAICIGLRNPDKFASISLFAANCNPTSWGHKIVFTTLLGADNQEKWKLYDGSEMVKSYDGPRREILLDQVGREGNSFINT
jgi:S-formylglutathione hydrolase